MRDRPTFHPVHDDYWAVVTEDDEWLEYASTDQFWELFEWADEAEKKIEELEDKKSFPTEDEMYNEMNRKFDLGKNHDEGMQIDDTQIGWENCYDWIKQTLKR